VGIGGFTTTEVAQRAGKSQGALFRYFPTKNDLLAATVEHLFAELRGAYEVQFDELVAAPVDARTSVREAVLLLWDVMSDPRLLAALDLYSAARTDSALAATIGPVVEDHIGHIHQLGAQFLPRVGAEVQVTTAVAWIDLAINAMQGLAIQELVQPNLERRLRLVDSLVAEAERLLTAKPEGTTQS
jgi:AcrR family transcriptional regulator